MHTNTRTWSVHLLFWVVAFLLCFSNNICLHLLSVDTVEAASKCLKTILATPTGQRCYEAYKEKNVGSLFHFLHPFRPNKKKVRIAWNSYLKTGMLRYYFFFKNLITPSIQPAVIGYLIWQNLGLWKVRQWEERRWAPYQLYAEPKIQRINNH